MGRFLTPDPYKAGTGSGDPTNPQSWNRYAYAGGDPINRYDPTGLDWWDPTTNTVHGDGTPIPTSVVEWMLSSWFDPADRDSQTGERQDQREQEREDRQARQYAQRLSNAIGDAIKALGKEKCAALFNGHDPVAVLKGLAGSDPSYGFFLFDAIPSTTGTVTSATTLGVGNGTPIDIGNGASIQTSAFVQVKINDMAGSFFNGSSQDRAVTLLHELGHVFSDLYGPSSSKIVSDAGSTATSQANTKMVKDNCFP